MLIKSLFLKRHCASRAAVKSDDSPRDKNNYGSINDLGLKLYLCFNLVLYMQFIVENIFEKYLLSVLYD